MPAFGVSLSHMTVWRDIQEQANLFRKRRHQQGMRVLGLDGALVEGIAQKQPVVETAPRTPIYPRPAALTTGAIA